MHLCTNISMQLVRVVNICQPDDHITPTLVCQLSMVIPMEITHADRCITLINNLWSCTYMKKHKALIGSNGSNLKTKDLIHNTVKIIILKC